MTRKTVADLNELLKKNEVIDFPNYRHIGLLGEFYQLCVQNKNGSRNRPKLPT